MQKKTRSLLEELDSMYVERDRRLIIETRADNIIASAIRLVEQIEAEFGAEQAENLTRKLLNAIRTKDAGKFSAPGADINVPTIACVFATICRLSIVSAVGLGVASIVPVPPTAGFVDVIVCVVDKSR
mgnify:CR=1 FL=1